MDGSSIEDISFISSCPFFSKSSNYPKNVIGGLIAIAPSGMTSILYECYIGQ
jgi:hypothetical protein